MWKGTGGGLCHTEACVYLYCHIISLFVAHVKKTSQQTQMELCVTSYTFEACHLTSHIAVTLQYEAITLFRLNKHKGLWRGIFIGVVLHNLSVKRT